jgi:putative phosphoribosyl transferase
LAAKRLPDRPHPEHYRRQAKDLLRGLVAAEPAALARLREHHPRDVLSGTAKLADAQMVLAREHGFASWPLFMAELRATALDKARRLPESIDCESGRFAVSTTVPVDARGAVLFLMAGQMGPRHAGMRQLASLLNRVGYATIVPDLLTEREAIEDAVNEELCFDVAFLTGRAELAFAWVKAQSALAGLPLALFCAGSGAAAGVGIAARHRGAVDAMVSCGGRPDLAGSSAWQVRAPSLFVVGGDDAVALGFTKLLLEIFPRDVPSQLEIVDGVGLRFDEGPAAARAAELAIAWLDRHLARRTPVGEAA